MEKFSVIIPTMWYSDRIHRNLSNLEDCDMVGEIILIDNNPSLKPTQIDYTKIRYITKDYNIFVNPAWNLGVELSKYDNICISNDDIIFSTDIFSFIIQNIDEGVFGMSTGNYYGEGIDNPYQINRIDRRGWGWGCLLFLKKQNYVPIDERLKIACGDDWLFHHMDGYEIRGLDLGDDRISQTSIKAEFFKQQLEDIKLWSQYLLSHIKDTTY